MHLAPGTRIGVYEVIARIGEGGMGEVYRARDTTLDRDVALKVLPAAVGADPDRLARFEREAKTLASLNHPHIAHVYGLAPLAAGSPTRALVMELVDGEDLSTRIARGMIPIDEALPIAREIAEALEAAHGAGVVHRDLKPANIKLRSGAEAPSVKVLDFGLAKTVEQTGTSRAVESPTITTPAMTAAGMVLGTAAYMSPEQAKGRAVDKRADIWAFGAVLYEMLTGTRAFGGDDVSETLAAILRDEPDWSRLPTATPRSIERLLRRCLVRDARNRIPDIAVARIEIDEALTTARTPDKSLPEAKPSRVWSLAALAALAGLAGGAVITSALRPGATKPEDSSSRGVHVAAVGVEPTPRVSPDGKTIVFVRNQHLVVRALADFAERTLEGTEGASSPFWSPDSASVGYFATGPNGSEIRIVPAAGGPSRTLVANAARDIGVRANPFAPYGAAWCASGIAFSRWAAGLWRTSLAGGEELIAKLDTAAGDLNLGYPSCLARDRLLAVRSRRGKAAVVVIDGATSTSLVEFDSGDETALRWPSATDSGHVLFERLDDTPGLWAVPVDPGLTRTTGPQQIIMAGAFEPFYAAGMLTAVTGIQRADSQLVWIDRTGRQLAAFARPQQMFLNPSLSPDRARVIVGGRRGDLDELWMHDERGVQRWTTGSKGSRHPAWSPVRNEIAYIEGTQVLLRGADGGEPRVVVEGANLIHPAWTPDGSALLYQEQAIPTGSAAAEIWIVGIHPPVPTRRLIADGREPAVSPDGKLVAYMSLTTGRREVYVTTFPTPSTVRAVSDDGGRHPRWSTANEIVFPCGPTVGADPNSHRYLCAARVESAPALRVGAITRLFEPSVLGLRATFRGSRAFDVAPDGRILISTDRFDGTPMISLIENFATWMQRKP